MADDNTTTPAWPDSLWAAMTPAGPALGQLPESLATDTLVVGAGFTGLSTALHLREMGIEVTVIEAASPGWGASGRNNGQVIPTLTRPEPDDLEARHGAAGERFVAVLRDCASTLFEVVRKYDLNAEAEQNGWIQPVHSPGRMKVAERRVEQWSRRGAPVEMLSRDEVIARTGSRQWYGGFWNRTGGHVNPLALARELARMVVELGGTIYERTPAQTISRSNDRWIVETPHGRISANRLMMATNAYSGEFSRTLMPEIARQVVPIRSWQMATRPLGDNLRAMIIPGREAVSDTHGDLHFMRYDARHRLITGGALIIGTGGASRLRPRIGARLQRLFPEIGDVQFDYVWNGYVGMTTDFTPRFHQLGPNGFAWVGCNGRGVGLSVALGREFARALAGEPLDQLGLPLSEPKPLPMHDTIRLLAPLRLIQYRWNDSREI